MTRRTIGAAAEHCQRSIAAADAEVSLKERWARPETMKSGGLHAAIADEALRQEHVVVAVEALAGKARFREQAFDDIRRPEAQHVSLVLAAIEVADAAEGRDLPGQAPGRGVLAGLDRDAPLGAMREALLRALAGTAGAGGVEEQQAAGLE